MILKCQGQSEIHGIDSRGDELDQGVDVLDDVLLLREGLDCEVSPDVVHEWPDLVPENRLQGRPFLAVVCDLHLEPLVPLQDVRVGVLRLVAKLALGQLPWLLLLLYPARQVLHRGALWANEPTAADAPESIVSVFL